MTPQSGKHTKLGQQVVAKTEQRAVNQTYLVTHTQHVPPNNCNCAAPPAPAPPVTPNYSTPGATPDFIHSETRRHPPAIVVEIGELQNRFARGKRSASCKHGERSARCSLAAANAQRGQPPTTCMERASSPPPKKSICRDGRSESRIWPVPPPPVSGCL